ncbi:phosphatase PAP2 family protein [Martelella sp. HB161492]|uniref:phosphatase PAP2 family protein n=1 Tax=Martelella sp. HB161492 TaxID=2720726 RepID=UPI0015919897|nr:phosphatase PAP2 family protein [Martelella sp. HB161492]
MSDHPAFPSGHPLVRFGLNWPAPQRRITFKATRWPEFLLPGATLVVLCLAVLDRPVAMAAAGISPVFRSIALALTDLSTSKWLLSAVLVFACCALVASAGPAARRLRLSALLLGQQALYLFSSLAMASAIANLVKRLIGRARPMLFDSVGDFHFGGGLFSYAHQSFPSGHSTAAGAFFGAMALLAPRYRPVFVSLALFFGFARVAVGAHYPSDVVAGLFFGAWLAFAMAVVFARYRVVFEPDCTGHPKFRTRNGCCVKSIKPMRYRGL